MRILPRAAQDSAAALLAAGADGDAPAVAFPEPVNAASCAPLSVVWYYSAAVPPAAACDIRITNVGVPQSPYVPPTSSSSSSSASASAQSPTARRRHRRQAPTPAPTPAPVTLELAHAQPVRTANHSLWLPQLRVPAGYYWLAAEPVDPSSTTRYYHSTQFLVAPGADDSCLFLPVLTSSSSSASSTVTLFPSPSSTPPPPPSLAQDSSRGKVIAGALGGGFAVISLLATFFLVRFFRDRQHQRTSSDNPDNPDAPAAPAASPGAAAARPKSRWRSSQPVAATVTLSAAKASSALLAPISVPASVGTSTTSTPKIGAVPLAARRRRDLPPLPPPPEPQTTTRSSTQTDDSTEPSSLVAERLAEGFVVPVTPHVIADGIMSERSSAGSGVGPVAVSPPAARVRFAGPAAPIPAAVVVSDPSAPASPRSGRSYALSATQVLQMSSRGS